MTNTEQPTYTWIEGFQLACRARKLSDHTIADYMNTLYKFVSFTNPETATRTQIREFLASRKVSNKTLLNYHIGLSVFYKWVVEESLRSDNPMLGIKRPKPETRVIQPIPFEHIKLILAAIDRSAPYKRPGQRSCTHTIPSAKRNQAIILLLLDTGMRVSELVGLKCADLDLKQLIIKLFGKGHKERIVSISTRTAQTIWRYRPQQIPSEYLFTDDHNHALGRNAINQILRRLCKKAGVPLYSPHDFRHTFAVEYLRNHPNIYTLQETLGHTTLDMVRQYLVISQSDIREAHRRASPVEHWGL